MAKKSILGATPSAKKAAAAPKVVTEEKKPVGAPKKGHDKKIGIYVPAETWKALQHQKIQEERPVSDIVNAAINAYLKSVGGPEAK
ncbi:hypothetical protein [Sulfitobacter sp. HGT1]|uniref:hypothetical protein n=1 Tax=Sulfitobacter sp. HGT1 TaxID=2735435 RepID=UPI0015945B0C|nr:hypothetical protein [Sulfitobacter sp. HGT1]